MARWRKRRQIFTSFVICGAAVVLGILLYPLIFLLFSGIALLRAVRRHPDSAPPFTQRGRGRDEARR